jgi:hypothetical protein
MPQHLQLFDYSQARWYEKLNSVRLDIRMQLKSRFLNGFKTFILLTLCPFPNRCLPLTALIQPRVVRLFPELF